MRESLASLAPLTPLPLALTGQFEADLQASLAYLPTASPPSEIHMSSASTITEPRPRTPHGRFRILRPHARGGLGEVFVAEDEELHREVALKEMQDRHADRPDSRSRFLLEAEITGGLEHPGIVPVYSLGQYGDGRPFYAMRFIRGDSLAEAIARFHGQAKAGQPATLDFASLAFRQLLRRFVDVCNAISYAHSRGVLHRDLKPGNILLGKYGETLVVDWGWPSHWGAPSRPSYGSDCCALSGAARRRIWARHRRLTRSRTGGRPSRPTRAGQRRLRFGPTYHI